MNKSNKMEETHAYVKELIKRDRGKPMVDKVYKKTCGNCGNDLRLPYSFCSFCGYRVKKENDNGRS